MTDAIFAGPSLSGIKIPGDLLRLPPVAEGDVYRLVTRQRPRAIAIIDGYFETRLAIWHKEILWALARGVKVLGAASIGALRAAELGRFGMIGVGRVFAMYRDSLLCQDDAVAVTHAPAELDFAPLTFAYSDLVCVMQAIARQDPEMQARKKLILATAMAMHFKERTFSGLEVHLTEAFRDPERSQCTVASIQAGWFSQKRRDALLCVEKLTDVEPVRAPGWSLHRTVYQRRAQARARIT